jgi:hypothetical protein
VGANAVEGRGCIGDLTHLSGHFSAGGMKRLTIRALELPEYLEGGATISGSGLKSMTRLALSSYDLWCDILATNAERIDASDDEPLPPPGGSEKAVQGSSKTASNSRVASAIGLLAFRAREARWLGQLQALPQLFEFEYMRYPISVYVGGPERGRLTAPQFKLARLCLRTSLAGGL